MKKKLIGMIFVSIITSLTPAHAQITSPTARPKILIIGGGLAGLSMAKSLENQGISPLIIERKTAYQAEGAGIAIPANGTWALQRLGIGLLGIAHPITQMTFTTDQGEALAKEEVTTLHPDGAQFYAIDRTKLLQHLKDSLRNTKIKMGTTVEKISQPEQKVTVRYTNGKEEDFDFVIVADGMHSQTHALLDPSYSTDSKDSNYGAEYLGIQIWRTIIPRQFDSSGPIYMLGSDRVFLLYPINDNQTYIYAHVVSEREGENPEKVNHISTLTTLFGHFGGHVPEALTAIEQGRPPVLSHYLETTKGTIWSQGQRILFIGDASRGFSPMLQNGAAQAFEDAYVLGELFKEASTEDEKNKIAPLYEKRRAARAQWVKETSDKKIVALGQTQVEQRNAAIKAMGAPNVTAFKVFMKENP